MNPENLLKYFHINYNINYIFNFYIKNYLWIENQILAK